MKILVSGLVNIETTLRVEAFPIEYSPVRYPFGGVSSSVSGVGVNVAKALKVLGDEPSFLSIVGDDEGGREALAALAGFGIETDHVLPLMAETARSVILYDDRGRRQINVDLKDIQEMRYPHEKFLDAALRAGDRNGASSDTSDPRAAILCNINFNRDLLPLAKRRGIPVCSDVHVLGDPTDAYNADFMRAAEILFLSDEGLWAPPAEAARELMDRYGCRIIVVGMGARGALLLEKGEPVFMQPAIVTRPVISTIGAGDALFASFLHYHFSGFDARDSLTRASVFASWKIGARGAAEGFPDSDGVEALLAKTEEGTSARGIG